MIFDTHTHYDDHRYDGDRESLLTSLAEKSVGRVVNVSAEKTDYEAVLALGRQYKFLYTALGVHPDYVGGLTDRDMEELYGLSRQYGYRYAADRKNPGERKVVAIGEIGLDYYNDTETHDVQEKWFRRQLSVAKELDLPVVIHSRDSAADTFRILKEAALPEDGGVIHCFSYEPEMAMQFIRMGYYIGIGGVVTFKNGRKAKETVAEIPLDRLLLETDCPYLAPTPYRGERNDSSLLSLVVQEIARIRNMREEEVMEITWNNANRFYRIED